MFDKNRFSYYNNLVESYSLGIFYVYNLCHIDKEMAVFLRIQHN